MKKYLFLLFSLTLFAVAFFTIDAYDRTGVEVNTASGSIENNDVNQNISGVLDYQEKEISSYGKAEDFTLLDLEGNEVSLSDYKGKKIFLNFWATWCPPCKAEMPDIEKVYQETKDSDLVILAVEIGEPLETVKSFIDENDYNFKVLLDIDQSVASTYNISSIPTSFFIDEDGYIIEKRVGGMNEDQMMEYIETLDQ